MLLFLTTDYRWDLKMLHEMFIINSVIVYFVMSCTVCVIAVRNELSPKFQVRMYIGLVSGL